MVSRKHSLVPASLSRLEKRFAAWRNTRSSGQRIPESLWRAAAKLASKHGLNRTARVLNLDYYGLKKRVDDASGLVEPSFIELPPTSPLPVMNECVIELEDDTGARMRFQLQGPNVPDLLALSRSFWNAD